MLSAGGRVRRCRLALIGKLFFSSHTFNPSTTNLQYPRFATFTKTKTDMAQIEHFFRNPLHHSHLSRQASLFWTETQLFSMVGLPTSTSFRMFPQTDIVPDYPVHIAHNCALIIILFIPHFVSWERSASRAGRGALGRELYPLSRGASPPTQYLIMFARVWLAVAWINSTLAQFRTGGNR